MKIIFITGSICLWALSLFADAANSSNPSSQQAVASEKDVSLTQTSKNKAPLFTLDAASDAVRNAVLPVGAKWLQDAAGPDAVFGLTVPKADEGASRILTIPIDLRPWRGSRVRLVGEIKAENVSVPARNYNGIKVQLHWNSAGHGDRWFDAAGGLYGTFDWKEVACPVTIDDDATTGYLNLGMQDSSGTVSIRNVRILPVQMKPKRPEPVANNTPIFKGHDLPRLRGVMAPFKYDEKDFADLKALNVNLIRWQIISGWGKADTDMDLVAYDKWLDAKLDETQKVLDAAKAHGMKVVIDMHSPPGGRLKDGSMRMFTESKYQDHYVAVWEKIARRFAGHPAIWAYDLLNEPAQVSPSPKGVPNYLGAQERAAKAVRAIDPKTAISITCDDWSKPVAFAFLEPVDVPNVLYQVHMYWPLELTHQGVTDSWDFGKGSPNFPYPGKINGKPLDKEALRRELQPVRDFQKAYGVHIYVGEFSTVRWTEGGARYLNDCIELFEEYGWDWSYHAFREWLGWSFEHADLPYSMTEHPKAETPTEREKTLRKWYDQNVHP